MKKNKVLGIAVALLGISLSVGTAIALYTQDADDTGFGIGAGSFSGSTGNALYTINGHNGTQTVDPHYCDEHGNNGGTGISQEYPQVKYEFALGASFGNNVRQQTYVMGKLSVSFSGLAAAYNNKVTVYAYVDGYNDGDNEKTTVGESTFALPLINNVTIDGSEHTSASGESVVSVASAGNVHKLVVWVKFTGEFDTLTANEATNLYTLTVRWEDIGDSYDACGYLLGDGNLWTVDDEYRMAIDPNETSWTYRYDGLVGSSTWTQCKAVRTNHKAGVDGLAITEWAADNSTDSKNFMLTNGTTYSIYWNQGAHGQTFNR